jgi:hypothetical protein
MASSCTFRFLLLHSRKIVMATMIAPITPMTAAMIWTVLNAEVWVVWVENVELVPDLFCITLIAVSFYYLYCVCIYLLVCKVTIIIVFFIDDWHIM